MLSINKFFFQTWSQVCADQRQDRLSGDSHPLQLAQVSLIINTHMHSQSNKQGDMVGLTGNVGHGQNRGLKSLLEQESRRCRLL